MLRKIKDRRKEGDSKMVEWHHQFIGHELGQTLGDGEDREAWHTAVRGVTKSWTGLNN